MATPPSRSMHLEQYTRNSTSAGRLRRDANRYVENYFELSDFSSPYHSIHAGGNSSKRDDRHYGLLLRQSVERSERGLARGGRSAGPYGPDGHDAPAHVHADKSPGDSGPGRGTHPRCNRQRDPQVDGNDIREPGQ